MFPGNDTYTIRDVYDLAQTDKTIRYVLGLVESGSMTFEYALIMALVINTKQCHELRQRCYDLLTAQEPRPRRFWEG